MINLKFTKINSLLVHLIVSLLFVFAIVLIFGSIYDTTDDLFMRGVISGNDFMFFQT